MALRRWLPFGVQKPFSGAVTAMIGSRNMPVRSSTSASLRWWVADRSRWNGVGSTPPIGRMASTSGFLPSGS